MIKVEDLGMNLLYFQNSKTWDYGTYKVLESDLANYEARKADGTLDVTVLERILYSHSNKALNQIKKDIDTKDILNIFTWSDLAGSRFIEALPQVMEAQLSGMITDGNKEIKKGSSYTGGGVDASIDASGFLLSHDRIYKAAEDVWFNNQLDKYEIEEGEDEHGNITYSLIDEAEGTVTKIVATVVLTDAQKSELEDEVIRKIKANPEGLDSKFNVVNQNGKDIIHPKAGRDMLLIDDSGNPIVPSSPNSAASVAIAEQKAQEASKDKADKTLIDVPLDAFIAKLKAAGLEVGIFNEFKGVETTAPAGTHNDLDWYINSTDKHIYLWHNNKWNNIGGGTTATLDKAAILNLLGLTWEQLEILKRTKEFTQDEKTKLALALTAHQDISGKANKTLDNVEDATFIAKLQAIGFTSAQIDILKVTEDFTQDEKTKLAQALTAHQDISGKANKTLDNVEDADFITKLQAIGFTSAQIEVLKRTKEFTQDEKTKLAQALTAHQDISGKANKGDSYTKIESDKKYEPLTTSFTPIASHQTGYILLDEAGIITTTIGTQIKLDLKGIDDMITNPANIPGAGDKLFIGINGAIRILNGVGSASLKWETKTNTTDINVKDNYKTKYFVLKKVSETEYDFVRLEDKPIEPAKPHWETIDQTTHTFTGAPLVRITFGHRVMAGYLSTDGHHWFFTHWYSADETRNIVYYWATWRHDKTQMGSKLYVKNSSGGEDLTINESDGDITKFEIWKEA